MTWRLRNLRSTNLNLVPILRALLMESSVTRAAKTLSLSPSATSGALSQLRSLLEDPLLVRVGTTMRLTPKAQQMRDKLQLACDALESLLLPQEFDPAIAQRTFIVGAIDYMGLLVGKRLMTTLRKTAPGIKACFVDVPADLDKRLATGDIDVGIAAMNPLSWRGIAATSTCIDRFVGVVDRKHALARRRRPSARDMSHHPQLGWDPGLALADRAAQLPGAMPPLPDNFCLRIQSLTSLASMVVGSDFVASMPRTLAVSMKAQLPLVVFELPGEPFFINTAVIWSTVMEQDSAHRWFRECLYAALRCVHPS